MVALFKPIEIKFSVVYNKEEQKNLKAGRMEHLVLLLRQMTETTTHSSEQMQVKVVD